MRTLHPLTPKVDIENWIPQSLSNNNNVREDKYQKTNMLSEYTKYT